MEVYDKTIEILDHRLIETGNRIAAEAALSIAGDSVDVWPNARFITFNDIMPSRMATFSFSNDENWERGDSYTWRAKFFNNTENLCFTIVAEYTDGTVEIATKTSRPTAGTKSCSTPTRHSPPTAYSASSTA